MKSEFKSRILLFCVAGNLGLVEIDLFLLQLAQRPTPIHPWRLPEVPNGFQVSIKRDDMTGSTLGGNKVCVLTLVGCFM